MLAAVLLVWVVKLDLSRDTNSPLDVFERASVGSVPGWLVLGIPREEAIGFGRVFRQNTIIYCQDARPELIVTDPTLDTIGRSFQGNWRVR